ncbi:MspA family porin [Nocardia anaemiae]|uniref:MspA family porin n=1 Tax=Nocardia anaemiae TaxID=263910 RepID=UPI000A0142A0|nr:MspA family porin [Nocardia anaemiae]
MKVEQRIRGAWLCASLTAVALITVAPSASADASRSDRHELSVRTVDGRTLVVGHRDEEVVNATGPGLIPTREAVVSNSAYAGITGSVFKNLKDAELIVGYHVGCAASLRSITASLGVDVGLVQPSLLVITPQVFESESDRRSNVSPKIEVKPKITASLAAGTISDIVIEKISLKDHEPRIDIVRTSIKAEGCLTGLTLRSYVRVSAKSKIDDEMVAVYGDPIVV